MAGIPAPPVRESLLARADQLGALPLALVVAPAGCGKSTLLAAWRRRVAERGEATGYLDVSPLHAEAPVLVSDLLEIARAVAPDFGAETARALAHAADEADAWRLLARSWLRDAAAAPALLVFLDNFHELPPQATAVRWLDEVLRARGGALGWVIASRGFAPPVATRMRGDGALLEVDAQDLSLRFEEVQRALEQHGVSGDDDLAARLLARTEGWAAGVQLAARRLARIEPADRHAFVSKLGAEPDVFAFVASEVLRDEPEPVLAAVEAVALLGRCSAGDVAELLDDPDAASAVARAVERGVLLAEGDDVRLHALWRERVAARAESRLPAADRDAFLRRAGALLERRGRIEGALEAYAGAAAWEPMARALFGVAEAWARAGRGERLRYWLGRLPEGFVELSPALLTLRGLTLLRPEPQSALPQLERAMRMYRSRGERRQERALAGALGTFYMAQMRRDDALRVLRRMITLRGVVTDPAERGGLYTLLAMRRYLARRFGAALSMAQRAARLPLDPATDWFNGQLLSWLYGLRGDLDLALAQAERLLAKPELAAFPLLHFGARLQRARLRLVSGDLGLALEDAERADEALREHRLPMVRELAALVIAHARSRLGDRAAARHWFDEALARAEARGGGVAGPTRVQRAVELVRWGESQEAAREAHRALESIAAGDQWPTVMPWLVGQAIWVIARDGDADAAQRLAKRHGRMLEMPDLDLVHWTTQLALADVARAAGATSDAERIARAAFERAARAGIRHVEPNVGALVVPEWAEWAVREGVCPDFALDQLEATAAARVPPLLEELVRHRAAEVRERAVRLLARRGGRDAHAPLRDAREDRVARVRDAARDAFESLDLRPRFALRVRSLGGFDVFRGDAAVRGDEWKGQTARRLFARLLVAEGRAVSREQLRSDLWPDAEPDAGRNNLRVAATRLNDALDPERPAGVAPWFVPAEGDALALRAEALADWDVARFRACLGQAEAAERAGDEARALAATCDALALYAGALLPEIDASWVVGPRRELAARFAAAAQRAGPRLLRRGRLEEAQRLADRWLAQDPADERAIALRMRVALARGDRAGALRAYEEAVTVLRRDLDVEPGDELAKLAARTRASG
jgi:ATP/maltotriose-dependent transcriptional regulator MalT/DNA-binding SARP family transcriptional activator